MNSPLKDELKSFLDRLVDHSQTAVIPAELYEADVDTLRNAISYIEFADRRFAAVVEAVRLNPQACAHVYEGRPIDGSNSASAPCKAVCTHCGHEPAVVEQANNAHGRLIEIARAVGDRKVDEIAVLDARKLLIEMGLVHAAG